MDSTTRFRFRDSANSASDDSSSVSSNGDDDDESKIESLTAKGVKRLCSELLELKKASDDDFHRSVYLNYSAFVRIFEQVGGVEYSLMHLKQHVLTQRLLVKDLIDSMYLEILSKESIDSIIEEPLDVEQSPLDHLESRTDAISETLDILLSEHRLDEALVILELEDLNLKMIHLEENPLPQSFAAYDSAISDRKSRLAYEFARLADNPRVAAPEFQKALSGLCRLGDSQCATQLLLKFYRSRLENGVHDMRSSKSYLHRTYIRELAKFVFSMISQAAKSFVLLYGEKSSYASELIQWAREETEIFAWYFYKYVKSISEVNGGLATAVEAAKYAISFCSILETQNIVLCPCLIKLIRPSMEEVLQMHIDHYKKVIGVFTATDDWVLGNYLMLGILKEETSLKTIGHQMDYCVLTNSGRKLVALLQATMDEVSPLVILQMETSILDGLLELFKEYIGNVKRAIPSKVNVMDRSGSRIVLAQTLSQQLSILANASALECIFSTTAKSIFKGIQNSKSQIITDNAVESLPKEFDNWIFSIQDVTNELKTVSHQHFIYRVISPEEGPRFCAENYCVDQGDSNALNDMMPSVAFQVLFLELRQLQKVGKDSVIEVDFLVEDYLRKLMEAFLVWLRNNKDFWITIDENSNFQQTDGFKKFVLDMKFLVGIAKFGGCCSNNMVDVSSYLISRMESIFFSAGVDPYRDIHDDEWATKTASEAIQKLLDAENSEPPQNDGHKTTFEEDPSTSENVYASDAVDDSKRLLEDSTELDDQSTSSASEAAILIPDIQKSKDTGNEEPAISEEDVLHGEAVPCSIRRQSGEGTEISNANNNAISLLKGSEIGETATGSPVDIVLEASDGNEDEKVLEGARSSCDGSTGSTDELVRNVDDGAEAMVVETPDWPY